MVHDHPWAFALCCLWTPLMIFQLGQTNASVLGTPCLLIAFKKSQKGVVSLKFIWKMLILPVTWADFHVWAVPVFLVIVLISMTDQEISYSVVLWMYCRVRPACFTTLCVCFVDFRVFVIRFRMLSRKGNSQGWARWV